MKTVLVTGGTGVVGKTLVKLLVKKGYRVKVLSRKKNPVTAVCANGRDNSDSWCRYFSQVEFVRGNITDPQALEKALKDVNLVFHLAAVITPDIRFQPDAGFQYDPVKNRQKRISDLYYDVNVKGTELLVQAAIHEGVDRVVFFSSISVYGSRYQGCSADESCDPEPDSLYALSKFEAEKQVLSAVDTENRPIGVVLRLASVYGPKEKKNYAGLIKMAKKGFFVSIHKSFGRGEKRPGGPGGAVNNGALRTLIHDHDLARAAVLAAEHKQASGKIYNVTDGSVHSMDDIRTAIERFFGRKIITFPVPESFVCFLIRGLEKYSARQGLALGLKRLISDTAVKGSRIQEELGFKPEISLERGWTDACVRLLASPA